VIPAMYSLRKYVISIIVMLTTLFLGYYIDCLPMLLMYKIGINVIAGLIETYFILHVIKLSKQIQIIEPIQS
jgi:hypothetical protein